jgi:hypothetical protein
MDFVLRPPILGAAAGDATLAAKLASEDTSAKDERRAVRGLTLTLPLTLPSESAYLLTPLP